MIGGKLAAANRGDMITVTGDGKSTVNELIANQINTDPRRGLRTASAVDHPHRLGGAHGTFAPGLEPDSVPAKDRDVLIQRNANHAFDVTDEVHPETAALAALAARDRRPRYRRHRPRLPGYLQALGEQGGAIVEVNAGPSLLMHLRPGVGKPRRSAR